MGIEIERKFTVIGDSWRDLGPGLDSIQGYLSFGPPVSVRVRIMGGEARLNLKQSTLDIKRMEFEYPIPMEDAHELLETSILGNTVEKIRYRVEHDGKVWEIDEFQGSNTGLIVAEIELSERDESFSIPSWLGEEVSSDARYLNSNLAQSPYTTWTI